jgi:excisionase family DNA binding protein
MDRLLTTPEEIQAIVEASILKALDQRTQPEYTTPDKLITEAELCKFLGVSAPTLIRWRKKRKIPFIRIGTCVRYNLVAVLKKLER